MCVYYLDEKLNAIYQQGSYIPEILQNSGRKYRTGKKVRKGEVVFCGFGCKSCKVILSTAGIFNVV
jgi:hypothetical protein